MISLNCFFAQKNLDVRVPQFDLLTKAVKDTFEAASRAGGGASDIQLLMPRPLIDLKMSGTGNGTNASDLHRALAGITRNKLRPDRRIDNIAILYADYYAKKPDVFGVMFDRGFSTWDDPNTSLIYTGIPREGCAIFVDAILHSRPGPPTTDFQQELLFTTIHELGHVFNLGHTGSPPNFMSTSPPGLKPYPPAAFAFTPSHCNILSRCSTTPTVWPGGSQFTELGDLNAPHHKKQRESAELDLRVTISQPVAHFFEPFELEMSLELRPGLRSAWIYDEVDAGYQSFKLFIEEPDGEVRLYRSPVTYCPTKRRLQILKGKPFVRDMSIFGQSGGFTFRKSGPHRIWARMQTPAGEVRSNVENIDIRSQFRLNERDYRIKQFCIRNQVSQALFHKRVVGKSRLLRTLSSEFIRTASGAAADYVLARTEGEKVLDTGSSRPAKPRVRSAIERLLRTIDLKEQTSHRIRLATNLVERLRLKLS